MPWWGWILFGVVLLGSELVVTTEFYLAFLGVAALLVALLTAALGPGIAVQWGAFAVLSAVLLLAFRRRFWEQMDRKGVEVDDPIVGETGTLSEAVAPGAEGRAELRGSTWTVRNVGDVPLEAGERVVAIELDGLVLLVLRAD